MIHKSSILIPADKCGVFTVNTFHLYKGFSRKFSKFGEYIKVSVRKTKPENNLTKKSEIVGTLLGVMNGEKPYFHIEWIMDRVFKLTPEEKAENQSNQAENGR